VLVRGAHPGEPAGDEEEQDDGQADGEGTQPPTKEKANHFSIAPYS